MSLASLVGLTVRAIKELGVGQLRLGQLGGIQDLADQQDYFLGNRQGPQVFSGELFFAAHDREV